MIIKNNEGSIFCKYKNNDVEFIFKKEISFEDDGYHILDYFTAFFNGEDDSKIGKIEPDRDYIIPLGKANKILEAQQENLDNGESCVIITYGMGVYWSKAAAKKFPGKVDIIDLRSLLTVSSFLFLVGPHSVLTDQTNLIFFIHQ